MKFFDRIKAIFTRFFHAAPSWVSHASMVLNFVAPLVSGILAELDPTEVPLVSSILDEVKQDLATAGTLLTAGAGTTALQTATDALTAVRDNLAALLTAGHIKDPARVAKVTGLVNTIDGELEAVLGIIPKS